MAKQQKQKKPDKPPAIKWADRLSKLYAKKEIARENLEVATKEHTRVEGLGDQIEIDYYDTNNSVNCSACVEILVDNNKKLMLEIGCHRLNIDAVHELIRFVLPAYYTKENLKAIINDKKTWTDQFEEDESDAE